MKTKFCNKCKKEKPISEFYKNKTRKDGLSFYCKECEGKIKKKWYSENKEITIERSNNWRKNNFERSQEIKKDWRVNNLEKARESSRVSARRRYELDSQKFLEYGKKWRKENPEKIRSGRNIRSRRRYREDIEFRLKINISSSIGKALKRNKGGKDGASTLDHLPYTIQQLKEHLESQFEPWMSWENHGVYNEKQKTWQIDHIIPQSKLLYDSMEHPNFQKCWSLENLQPLETIKNIKKRDKF